MANFSHVTDLANKSSDVTDGGKAELIMTSPTQASFVAAILVNSISFPFTILLNVLVIMAVRTKPGLRTNTNILLVCLAAADALSGLVVQPMFVAWKVSELVRQALNISSIPKFVYSSLARTSSLLSSLHLMLVSFERLVAIKYSMRYVNIVTTRKIQTAVIAIWVFSLLYPFTREVPFVPGQVFNLLVSFILFSSVFVVVCVYAILFRETLRHLKKIKTQQLPQEEVARVLRENKALKTTVLVVGAVLFCYLPLSLCVIGKPEIWSYTAFRPWPKTLLMLNSLLNPLIYCARQKEMRRFVKSKFKFQSGVVNVIS